MAKYIPKNCRCSGKRRYVSPGITTHADCIDVCTNPVCGTPDTLTLLAPVVYDEIGINLCREIPLTGTITGNPPLSASAQILDVTFGSTGAGTTVSPIPGRPNCYLVTLTNLSVNFAVNIYDCSGRLINTLTETAVYLPPASDTADSQYLDDETNPSSVELEIFAPYGLSYRDAAVSEPVINYIGFSTTNNALRQGLNMIAIPRILSFDPSAPSLTLGISVYIKSVYFSQYLFPNKGRASVPKGSIVPDEDTICMDFVSGELLDYEIKPLELGPPKCEEKLKKDCAFCTPCCSSVRQGDETGTPSSVSSPAAPAVDTGSGVAGSAGTAADTAGTAS